MQWRRNSQIATILTLVIAAVFLFIAITINIGRASKKKTLIDNACDNAGLFLASGLGSVGSNLKQELGIYDYTPPGKIPQNCDVNFYLIGGGLAIIISGALALTSGGLTLAAIPFILGAIGGAVTVASQTVFATYIEAGQMREMQTKFQNMTGEQRLFEGAIQSALFSITDDPKFVPDRFDVDRDNLRSPDRLDKITRFNHWYFQRLNSLPRLGGFIDEMFRYLFAPSSGTFRVIENQSWNAQEAYFLGNLDWGVSPGGVRNNGAADWLENNLRPFLEEMRTYGYGVSFHNPIGVGCFEILTDLEKLILEIRGGQTFSCVDPTLPVNRKGLEDEAKGLYGSSKDELIGSFETWLARFYNGNPAETGNWYFRLGQWEDSIRGWANDLSERQGQALNCIQRCEAGPGCYQDNDTYPCGTPDAPGAICGGGCKTTCLQQYDSCGNACEKEPQCRPEVTCSTPTGGEKNCCESGVKLKVDCYNITRIQSYITKLDEFIDAIANLRTEIVFLYTDAQRRKNTPWERQAIYVWKDTVLNDSGQEVQAETPAHMVFVRLDVPEVNTPQGPRFLFPNLKQEPEWQKLSICKRIENASGTFRITVGRYDEDLAKQGPLSNFWSFKFRRNAGDPEPEQDLTFLRSVADIFARGLNEGQSVNLDDLVTVDQFRRLAAFCENNGIVSSIEVNYGPGMTYNPDEPGFPGSARERNRDIYIRSRAR